MKKSLKTVKATLITSIAVCGAAGAVAMMNTKKAKARRIARKAGKKLEFVGSMLQNVANMTR